MEPLFLTLDEVLQLHISRIQQYGGSHGIRDRGLLESALAQPRQSFNGQYLHPNLPAMAAAYLFHIVRNHPFIDGNKRTGAAAAIIFLDMNGLQAPPDEQSLGDLVLAVAAGTSGKDQVTQYFEQNTF